MKLAEILINDYEVEETPEDELLKLYDLYRKNLAIDCGHHVILKTLSILDIKIKGIND